MRQLVFLFIAGTFLFGCPTTGPGKDGGRPPECESRTDCVGDNDGKVCTAQQYCENCDSSGQCRVKEACSVETHLCVLREGWGTACNLNEDCQAGEWCKQGLCVDRNAVSLCPGGTNGECPQSQRCNTLTTVCEEDLGCSENGDCALVEVCNTGSRQCVPRCTVDTQAQICGAQEKCVDEKCVQCANDQECGPGLVCDAAGRCSAGNRCYSDRDCKVPLVCFTATGACLTKAPPCVSNDNCAADQRCDVGKGKCVPKTCQPDRFEPNEDVMHAYGISQQTYLDLTLCMGDVDWYSVALGRGDQLGVNIDADNFSENTFSTVIKDATGRSLAAGKLLVNYVAPAAATYYVVISTSDPFQPYDVTFLSSRGTPCDDDALEPNDSSTQATAINTASMLDGSVCPQDQDWFKAVVPASKALQVSLTNYDASKGLLELCVFDGTTSLGCSDTVMPMVSVGAASAGGKNLNVRVKGAGERTANGYTLRVDFL